MPDDSWRGMDRAALDAAYDNSAAVADSAGIVAGWKERSAGLREQAGSGLDLAYGERPRENFDFFPAQESGPSPRRSGYGRAGGPLFVFIHGGYWQMREKETFACFAKGPLEHGFNVAIPGYTLAPEVRIGTIVEEMRTVLTHLAGHADELGFDRHRIFVGGWSAGGHLTAMMLDHPLVKGGLAISGIFELEPIAHCYVNDRLRLDAGEVEEFSPLRHLRPGLAPIRLAVGGAELDGLKGQSRAYAKAARKAGLAAPLRTLEGHDHFTILSELEDPQGALTQELVKLEKESEG